MLAVWAHQQIAGGTNAPVNTVAPAVTGSPVVGQELSVDNGTWTGNPEPEFTYQWQRDGVDIDGATASVYLLDAADLDTLIRAIVTATNFRGSASANSNEVGPVAAA